MNRRSFFASALSAFVGWLWPKSKTDMSGPTGWNSRSCGSGPEGPSGDPTITYHGTSFKVTKLIILPGTGHIDGRASLTFLPGQSVWINASGTNYTVRRGGWSGDA